MLAELANEELPDDAAMAVTALSALATTLTGDDPSELWALVGDVRAAPPPIQLAAAAAYLLGGNAREAVEISVPLAVHPMLPSAARWRAALWSVAGMATTGQLDAAIELCERIFAELGDEPDGGGFDVAALWSAVILAHERRGDLRRADALARQVLEQPGADDDDRARPRMLQCMARVALLRGEPTVAARQMRDVLADLGGADEVFTAWNLSLLAVADAMRGRPDLAAQSLREMDAAPHDLAVYRPEQEYSRSQVLAYAGDLAAARTAAIDAAAMATSMGQQPIALLAWSAVARYGDPRAARRRRPHRGARVSTVRSRKRCASRSMHSQPVMPPSSFESEISLRGWDFDRSLRSRTPRQPQSPVVGAMCARAPRPRSGCAWCSRAAKKSRFQGRRCAARHAR